MESDRKLWPHSYGVGGLVGVSVSGPLSSESYIFAG